MSLMGSLATFHREVILFGSMEDVPNKEVTLFGGCPSREDVLLEKVVPHREVTFFSSHKKSRLFANFEVVILVGRNVVPPQTR